MRYRKLTSSGDMTFGHNSGDFYINNPEAVGQLVSTNLQLWVGEWFLDTAVGTPYATDVLGKYTSSLYDLAIQQQVLQTEGVTQISAYSSTLNTSTRKLTVTMTLNTVYGPISQPLIVTL